MTKKNWASPGSQESPPEINTQLTSAMMISAKVGGARILESLRKRKHLCGIRVVAVTSRRASQIVPQGAGHPDRNPAEADA